jgi:DNA replication protein DnaC
VHAAIPEVAELDRELSLAGLSIMRASLDGENVEEKIAEVRRGNTELRRKRAILLTAHGYPADYTEVRYECEKCNDSGFIDTRMCTCMKKKLVEASYARSGMGRLMREQTFDNFSLEYYASDSVGDRVMRMNYAKMKKYAEDFDENTYENLALFGPTGLGKTHLSSAVARGVIERGCDVFYVSAVSMLSDFERERFGNSAGGETGVGTDRYFSCDLLIIDDLGTEVNNQFTTSVLYNLINTRLNKRQSTVINTNLTQDEFRKRYWDRITSRVLGEYTVLPFLGTDVRAQKLSRKV